MCRKFTSNKEEGNLPFYPLSLKKIELKGLHLNHDFNVVVGKQCRTENA